MELSTQTRNAIASRQLFALAASEADVTTSTDASGIRLVSGLVVPFDVEVDRGFFTGIFRADSTELPDDLSTVKLLVDHDHRAPVGYGIEATKDADGLRMTFAVPTDHPRSAEYLQDLDALLKDGFSVGVEYTSDTVDAIVARMFGEDDATGPIELGAVVREVSGLAVPAFNGARVGFRPATLATFGTIPNQKEPAPVIPDTIPGTIPDPAAPAAELPTVAELATAVRAELGGAFAAPVAHPLSAYATFDEFASAVWNKEPGVRELARFALANQITGNNPGVIPPAWVTEIAGIVDAGRTLIQALGGPRALPSDGMTLTWPTFAGDLTTLIGEQTTQKTEVTSARVDITQGTQAIKTYAGASDIAYQLLRRSSPAYRDAYERILALAYALVTERAFEDFVEAAATALVVGATGTVAQIKAALFKGSRAVKSATGLPASVVAVASNIFDTWGGIDGLTPQQYGTQNVPGTADASSLRINISGLEVVDCPAFATGLVVVTNPIAAQWWEDGPFPVSADDVAKLGLDVGLWGMGAPKLQAAGIVKLTAA